MPCALECEIARRTREDGQSLLINAHRATLCGPVRNAKLQRELSRLSRVNCEPCSLLFRKRCFLAQSDSLLLPVELGRDVEVHINTARVVKIDRVGEFGKFLGP